MKRALFYPCCGRDLRESVKSWLHIVDDFWFAEISYCSTRKRKTGEIDTLWREPNLRDPQLEQISQVESVLIGETGQSPVITRTYTHKKLHKTVTLNFVGGCAVDAFNRLPIDTFSVFVNRGDHRVDAEGSSGICWLSDEGSDPYPEGLLLRVLQKLDIGGFIVSDGSNADHPFASHFDERDFAIDVHLSQNPVMLHGRSLKCVGMLEPKYGPTLVWQVVG